jgi:hypothetical protein
MFNWLNKILGWAQAAFSFVDFYILQYKKVKDVFPELINFIEDLYDLFAVKIMNKEVSSEEAREEVVTAVGIKFTNSPLSIPEGFIRMLLEIVHGYKTSDSKAYYDRDDVRAQAERVLKGLRNKYGSR